MVGCIGFLCAFYRFQSRCPFTPLRVLIRFMSSSSGGDIVVDMGRLVVSLILGLSIRVGFVVPDFSESFISSN